MEARMNFLERRMANSLSRNWWVLLVRGLIAIAFGVLTWMQPGISLAAFVLLFGAYVLVDGVLTVWTAIAGHKENSSWWILLLWGLVGIAAGVVTLLAPGITALVLLFYIAAWAIVTGVLEIVAAIRLRKEIDNEWWLILGGIISVLFGVLIMAQPGAGALALGWLIATYAFIFGVLLVMLAFRVRRLPRQPAPA
jgi:uncharacterized membrane protein HdeD (DUF308 family)